MSSPDVCPVCVREPPVISVCRRYGVEERSYILVLRESLCHFSPGDLCLYLLI